MQFGAFPLSRGNPRRKAQSLLTSPSSGKSPSSLGVRLPCPCTPGGAAGEGLGKGGTSLWRCPVPAHAHPSLHATGGNTSEAGALSLPNPGYFKPGEWEMLATEAQSLGFAARGLGRGVGHGSEGHEGDLAAWSWCAQPGRGLCHRLH